MVGGIARSVGGFGGPGGNIAQLLPKLNIEVGKLISEFANMQIPITGLLKSVQDATQPAAGVTVPGGPFGSLAGSLGPLVTRLAYVAVLKEAMDKATNSKTFNIETAVNDLWIHLEAIKKLGSAPATAASGGAGGAVELAKLRDMLDKRQQLFQILTDMTRMYNETARGMIQNLAR
jgi:hypothetical protein